MARIQAEVGTMKMTTATYRKRAREAEEQGRYALAADYYKLAIDNYPSRGGQLDQADLKQLNEAYQCASRMARVYIG